MAARAGQPAGFGGVFAGTVAAVLLFVLFLLLGFPYGLLAQRIAGALERELGARLVFGEVGPGLGFGGPRLTVRDVRLAWADGATLEFERLRLRPAWSLSWLRAQPALRIGLSGEPGAIDGTVWLGASRAFAGEVHDFDLEALPLEVWRPGVDLGGKLDGSVEVAVSETVVTGSSQFQARDGLIGLPVLPLAVPYAVVQGELRLGEGGVLEVLALDLEGPMLGVALEGSVGPGQSLEQAPLRLTGRMRVPDAAVRRALAAPGLRFKPDGTAEFRVAGTLASPSVR